MRCLTDKETVDLMSGLLREEKALDAVVHVQSCKSCEEKLQEFADIRGGIASRPGEFEDEALVGEIMTLIDLGRGERERLPSMRRASPSVKWSAVAAAAAVVLTSLLVFRFADFNDKDPSTTASFESSALGDFASRGGAPSEDQWVSITLFERSSVNGEAAYLPIGKSISKDAAVAASYEDRSAPPFPYLMVFAVDGGGAVFWYYPEVDDLNKEQIGIETSRKQGKISLPDEVTHDLSLGPLRFFAIFSKSPLSAGLVESTVKRQVATVHDLSEVTRIDLDGTGQWTQMVQVVEGDE